MKSRIIITSDIDDPLFYVRKIMKEGFISGNNDCYCNLTRFRDGVIVSCEKTRSGFSFRVWDENVNRNIPK